MAITQTQAKVQEKSKIKPLAVKSQTIKPLAIKSLAVKPPIVSYEIPDSFNPFATGERLIRLEFELKNQRELMKQGFEDMNKRFEDMNKNMDKRFEAVDKRFEDMQKNTDKRFEDMNKRFEDMQKYMNKRFNMMTWIIGGGFTITFGALATLIALIFQAT